MATQYVAIDRAESEFGIRDGKVREAKKGGAVKNFVSFTPESVFYNESEAEFSFKVFYDDGNSKPRIFIYVIQTTMRDNLEQIDNVYKDILSSTNDLNEGYNSFLTYHETFGFALKCGLRKINDHYGLFMSNQEGENSEYCKYSIEQLKKKLDGMVFKGHIVFSIDTGYVLRGLNPKNGAMVTLQRIQINEMLEKSSLFSTEEKIKEKVFGVSFKRPRPRYFTDITTSVPNKKNKIKEVSHDNQGYEESQGLEDICTQDLLGNEEDSLDRVFGVPSTSKETNFFGKKSFFRH